MKRERPGRNPTDPVRLDSREEEEEKRATIRRLAHILDTAIPLPGGLRIGLDGIIGLIPGVGDLIGTVLSSYIVAQAYRLGASRAVMLHMAGNVLLEALVGLVPVLGDLFDFAWKANRRNVDLLERQLQNPGETQTRSSLIVAGTITGLLLIGLLVAYAGVALIRWLLTAAGG